MWKAVILVYLMICALYDMRKHKLPMWILAAGTLVSLGIVLISERDTWYLWVSGGAVGVLFLMAGRITKESIGYGDGWMILNLGICCGIWKLCSLLFMAFLLIMAVSAAGMVFFKWKKEKRIPMVPFLFIGYVGVLAW